MGRKLSNFLLIGLTVIIAGCNSTAETAINYPNIENNVIAKVKARPNGRFVISKDDNDIDIIKPFKEKTVKYHAPSVEHIISKDVDSEVSRSFWNVVVVDDDSDADFISNDVFAKARQSKQPTVTETSQPTDNSLTEIPKSEISQTQTNKETDKTHISQNSADSSFAAAKQQNSPAERGNLGLDNAVSEQKIQTPKTITEKTPAQKPKQTAKTVQQPKKQQFVPVRKIDEESLDMTNLKNLKVKEMPLIQQTGVSNGQIVLSMAGDQWIIKDINPPHLALSKRENSDKNTVFTFDVKSSGEVDLVFVRTSKNTIIRQPYKITIKESENKAQPKSPKNEISDDAAYKSGMQAKKQGKPEQAAKFFEAALTNADSPYYVDALTELINIHKNNKDYQTAQQIYNKYTTQESRADNDKLNILENDFYVLNNDYKNAINGYQKFLSSYPDSKLLDKALFYLAYSLENYKINPNYKEAYRIYNIIIDKYPESKYHKASINRSLYLERHYLKIN